jgi:hypothetical protein
MGKKRTAQDITKAREENESSELIPANHNTSDLKQQKKKRKKTKKRNNKKNVIKDPKEAHSYLSLWQQQQQHTGQSLWRFNKNTQSWLLRHMYNVDKIPKSTFSILILYIEDLRGASRERVYEDAVRRAFRYKEWEKKSGSGENKKDDNHDAINTQSDKASDDKTTQQSDDEDDEKADEARWNSLNYHDKRKEYKRARKLIDVLKVNKTDDNDQKEDDS